MYTDGQTLTLRTISCLKHDNPKKLYFVSVMAEPRILGYSQSSRIRTHFTCFALFLGVAMSITAFPVLARILTDQGLDQTDLGVMALGCAAADDVTAWCLLTFVVGVANAKIGNAVLVAVATLVI
jgi:Kef-type K+ transport system membrane component KefB